MFFKRLLVFFAFIAAATLLLPGVAFAAAEGPNVQLWPYPPDVSVEAREGFVLPTMLLGADMAAADLGTDGIDELIVGSPIGATPMLQVLRADGSTVWSVAPFTASAANGVAVAAGDVDGDGIVDIVVASVIDGVATVRIFGRDGIEKTAQPVTTPLLLGSAGISLAIGDIDGDKKADIILGSGSGVVGRVVALSGTGQELGSFVPFGVAFESGIHVAAGDIDGDGKDEVVLAKSYGDGAIDIFSGITFAVVREFTAIDNGFVGGLNLAVADLDGDSKAEIIAAPNGSGGPHVHVFSGDGALRSRFFAFEEPYRGGVTLAGGAFAGGRRIVTAWAERNASHRPHYAKYISVDISEQRLRAYENGRLVKTFLVSTGVGKTTPRGEWRVLAKPEFVHYAGRGYDLGWVHYNLRFYPHIYIHFAPWHNNFGHPMSHGCVNVNFASAKWVFGWANIGTPVLVQE